MNVKYELIYKHYKRDNFIELNEISRILEDDLENLEGELVDYEVPYITSYKFNFEYLHKLTEKYQRISMESNNYQYEAYFTNLTMENDCVRLFKKFVDFHCGTREIEISRMAKVFKMKIKNIIQQVLDFSFDEKDVFDFIRPFDLYDSPLLKFIPGTMSVEKGINMIIKISGKENEKSIIYSLVNYLIDKGYNFADLSTKCMCQLDEYPYK